MKTSSASKTLLLPGPLPANANAANAITQLQHRAQERAALLKALANPDRLLLLWHLLDTERTVASPAVLRTLHRLYSAPRSAAVH